MEKVKVKLPLFGLFLCLLAIVYSCSEGDFTIFYQVSNEEVIKDSDLENKLTVQGMVNVNSRYYVAAGKIFTRRVDSDDWDDVTNSNLQNDVKLCNSMALLNGYIYASFYAKDGESFGLYWATPGSTELSWNKITDANVVDKQTGGLKVVNNLLFVSVKNSDGTYSLVYTNDNDPTNGQIYILVEFFIDGPDISTFSSAVKDIDYYAIDGMYWILEDDNRSLTDGIYRSNLAADATEYIAGPTISGRERYEGIVCTDDNQIYISTSKGKIWFYNGMAWTSQSFDYTASDGSEQDVWFNKFLQVPGSTSVDMIVVGTQSVGFYEINEDLGLNDIDRFSNTSKSELYSGSVELFFNNSNTLFVLSAGTGIWHSSLQSDGTWGNWTWE